MSHYLCLIIQFLVYMYICNLLHVHVHIYISVFEKLIWHTIGPKSFLFGTAQFSLWASGAVNYDYIVTNSITSLLIWSRCIPNGAHTNHFWTNLAHASRLIKNCDIHALYNTELYSTMKYRAWMNMSFLSQCPD